MADEFCEGSEADAALDHLFAAPNLGLISVKHCGMTYVHICEPTSRQQSNENFVHFYFTVSTSSIPQSAKELADLRTALDLTQTQMGRLLGVSREWVSKLENDQEPISEFVKLKLNEIVNPRVNLLHTVAEDQSPYGDTRKNRKDSAVSLALKKETLRIDRVQINAGFTPPAPMPTREDCLAHVEAYLAAAANVPGGFAIALHKIKRAMPLDDFSPAESSP